MYIRDNKIETNFVHFASSADKIWKKIGKETEVMVYLDDIPLNDFKSVWRNGNVSLNNYYQTQKHI